MAGEVTLRIGQEALGALRAAQPNELTPPMWLVVALIRLPEAIAAELRAFYAHLRRER